MTRKTFALMLFACLPVLAATACSYGEGHYKVNGFSLGGFDLKAKAERTDVLPLDLGNGERLVLSTHNGRIDVQASADATYELRAHVSIGGRSQEEADKALAGFKLRAERTSDGVVLHLDGEPLVIDEGLAHYSVLPGVDYTAVVPAGVRVEAKSGSGNIKAAGALGACKLHTDYGNLDLSGIQGDLDASSSSGSLLLAGIKAGVIEARSDYGSLRLQGIAAESLKCRSSSGDLNLTGIEARQAEAHSDYGNLTLRDIKGALQAKTSSGSLRLSGASGGPFVLRSDYGSLTLEKIVGRLDVHTSSGEVGARECSGAIDASSDYGAIALDGVFPSVKAKSSSGAVAVRALAGSRAEEPWELRSDYGAVSLHVPADFACRLDARTDYGSVESDFQVLLDAGKRKDRALVGVVGEGGELVKLRASSGDVALKKL